MQGTHLGSATQAQIQTITVAGLVFSAYTVDGTATGEDSRSLAKGKYRLKSDGTALCLYLTDADKAALQAKPGMANDGLKDGLLSVSSGSWAGLNTAKALAVSGNPPTITSATYNSGTGVLVITGVNLPKAVTGWDFNKLSLVSGDGTRFKLPQHSTTGEDTATGSAASATSLTIILSGRVKAQVEVRNMLSRNGLKGRNGGVYNLEAAAGFAGGSSAADTSNNPITVSGYPSHINRVQYFADTGELRLYGDDLPPTVAEWDFSKLTIVSGDGKKRYPLPKHATAGENTATGSVAAKEA